MNELNCVKLVFVDAAGIHTSFHRIDDSNGATTIAIALRENGAATAYGVYKIIDGEVETLMTWNA